jgi:pimeloyl-ACP methyl ester carboxylesterase
MKRRTFVATAAAAGTSIAASTFAFGQPEPSVANAIPEGARTVDTGPRTGYAPVNGLDMYYEIHGAGGVPLVLLHGAFMTIETFGPLLPALAETRQVIVPEMQAHGRTADVDRPLSYEQMADDTAALLRHLGIAQGDVVGYSMGGGIAWQLAVRHPELVRKLVAASVATSSDGINPEYLAVVPTLTPEGFEGTPGKDDYVQVAPNPEDFPALVAKIKQLDMEPYAWPAEAILGLEAPSLIVIGDSDVVRLEHAVELFLLRGGGVFGDISGLPASGLAVLPRTTHVGMLDRTAWLVSMTTEFLDAPLPEAP